MHFIKKKVIYLKIVLRLNYKKNCNNKKAETIIDTHTERRKEERDMDPLRFNRKPTVAELCLKRPADRPSTDGDPKSTADDSDSFSYGKRNEKIQTLNLYNFSCLKKNATFLKV